VFLLRTGGEVREGRRQEGAGEEEGEEEGNVSEEQEVRKGKEEEG
jgi:hypothetical protein